MSAEIGYEVVAVRYGELSTTRSGVFLNYGDYGEPDGPALLAYYFWIIRSRDRTIVLDTGFSAGAGDRRGRTLLVNPRDAFAALEVPDDERTTIVLSHAHYDHIGNVDWFRRATFVMGAAEYDFWVERPRAQHLTRQLVEPEEIERLRLLRRSGRLELVSGSVEIAPGITALPAPGHTPGGIMLAVQSGDGRLLLAADAVHLDEEFERRMPFRHMCDIVAAADCYDSIADLLRAGVVRRVIAGHEPELAGPFPSDARLPEHTHILSTHP